MVSAGSPLFLEKMRARLRAQQVGDSREIENQALDAMRREIPDRTRRHSRIYWVLRHATDVSDPFVVSDQCAVIDGEPRTPPPTPNHGLLRPKVHVLSATGLGHVLVCTVRPYR